MKERRDAHRRDRRSHREKFRRRLDPAPQYGRRDPTFPRGSESGLGTLEGDSGVVTRRINDEKELLDRDRRRSSGRRMWQRDMDVHKKGTD